MASIFERWPALKHNCIGFAYFRHGLIKPEYACDFPVPEELYRYFRRTESLDTADTIGIIGSWYGEICFVHLAVRFSSTQFIHRRNFYRPEPEIILPCNIKPDGSHSTSEVVFDPGKPPVSVSFPEEKVFLRLKK